MKSDKMLALLGAITVTAAAVPAVATIAKTDSDNQTSKGLVLYSGSQDIAQSVNWHTSHGSHTSSRW